MNDLLLLHYSTVTDLPSPWAEGDEEVKKPLVFTKYFFGS